MKIKDLQHPYKEMALINQERQGNERDENRALDNAFRWAKTPEGIDFWDALEYGLYLPKITPEIKADYPEVFGEDNQPKYGQTVWVTDDVEDFEETILLDKVELGIRAVYPPDLKCYKEGKSYFVEVYGTDQYRTTDPAKDKKVLELSQAQIKVLSNMTLDEIAERLGVDEVIVKD